MPYLQVCGYAEGSPGNYPLVTTMVEKVNTDTYGEGYVLLVRETRRYISPYHNPAERRVVHFEEAVGSLRKRLS